MSSVPRATFDALKADYEATIHGAINDFAKTHKLSYDRRALFDQCGWAEGSSLDVLMFGMDVFPADIDDDGGEPMIPTPLPANENVRRPHLVASRLALAAGLLLALATGMWTGSAIDGADAFSAASRRMVSDATLGVTLTTALLPDAAG